mgnify:CR=1 FL=1
MCVCPVLLYILLRVKDTHTKRVLSSNSGVFQRLKQQEQVTRREKRERKKEIIFAHTHKKKREEEDTHTQEREREDKKVVVRP